MQLAIFAFCCLLFSNISAAEYSSFDSDINRDIGRCQYRQQGCTISAEVSRISHLKASKPLYDSYAVSVFAQVTNIDTGSHLKNYTWQTAEDSLIAAPCSENKRHFTLTRLLCTAAIFLGILIALWWGVSQLRVANRLRRSIADSSIKAARAINRAATAAEKAYKSNTRNHALSLRPYIKLEKPAYRFINSNGSFYMVLTMVATNYGSTPAKNFTSIETQRLSVTAISSSGEEKGHATLNSDSGITTRAKGFSVKYIGPDAEANMFVSTRLALDNESKEIFEIIASRKPGKWKVLRIYFVGILCFKDDYGISANEHYELKFRFLAGFGDEPDIRIESERICPDGST